MFAIRPRSATLTVMAAAIAVSVAPHQLQAQDVQYETVTTTALPGALGTVARLAARLGGGSMEVVEQTSIKGQKMRVDSEQSSTITDLENGRIIYLDHDAKTYTEYTFEEMIAQARQAADEMKAAGNQRTVSGSDTASARIEFSVSVDDARQQERVAGHDAKRFFLTMQAETEYVPEDGSEMEQGGTLVVLTDMWSSNDGPLFAARDAFDQSTARELATASAALTEGIAAAFADDPQMRVAFEKSAEEAGRIEGMPVKTVVHFVVVPPNMAFDRDAVTNPSSSGGTASAVAGAAQQAARAGLGRLAGRFGGRQAEPEPEPEAEMKQTVMLTVTTEVRNVRTAALDASLFQAPADYRRVTP